MSSKIKIVLGIVLVVVLVVIAVGVLSCGDDDGDDGQTSSTRDGGDGGDGGGGDDDDSSGDPPPLRTVKSGRGEGMNATAAAASGSIDKPEQIWLRVSAAPKQQVKGSWNVSCGGGTTVLDAFEVTPPHLLRLRIPRKNPDSCIAGATAQLSGKGRLKIAILRER